MVKKIYVPHFDFLKKNRCSTFFVFFRCAHSARSNLVFRRVGNGLIQVHDQRRHPKCNLQVVKYANVFSKFEKKKTTWDICLFLKILHSTAFCQIWHTKNYIPFAVSIFGRKFGIPSQKAYRISVFVVQVHCDVFFFWTFFVWNIDFFSACQIWNENYITRAWTIYERNFVNR